MKTIKTIPIAIFALTLAFGAQAYAESGVKGAKGRVRDQLPAKPPKVSSGTAKGPFLKKPDPSRKPTPKFKEVPSPVSSDKRKYEGQTDPEVKAGWDRDRKKRKKQKKD